MKDRSLQEVSLPLSKLEEALASTSRLPHLVWSVLLLRPAISSSLLLVHPLMLFFAVPVHSFERSTRTAAPSSGGLAPCASKTFE